MQRVHFWLLLLGGGAAFCDGSTTTIGMETATCTTIDMGAAAAATATAATEPAPGLFYLDGVLGGAALATLKARFNASMQAPPVDGRRMMGISEQAVAARLATALLHRHRDGVGPMDDPVLDAQAGAQSLYLPIDAHVGDYRAHKDHYHTSGPAEERVIVQGQVGLVYLAGDGRMVFTHDAKGRETAIDILPGRFIAWDNAAYTHRVERGPRDIVRQLLGPLTWDMAESAAPATIGAGRGLLGVCGFPTPTPEPTPEPTTAAPTGAPVTAAPTVNPSAAPTPVGGQPTPFPTFGPQPGNVHSVGQGIVCGPESFPARRKRALEEEVDKEEAVDEGLIEQTHRELTSWTPESCFYACKASLNNPPSFVINIYFDANDQQVCTCCLFCEGIRYVPSAQLFAACSGPGSGLALAAKASHAKGAGVRRGGRIKYAVRMKNKPALQGVGVRVVLPPHVSFLKASARPPIRPKGQGPTVNGSSVDWPQVPTPAKQRRVFTVFVRISEQAPVGTPLVFSSYAYQSTPNGLTFCDNYAKNFTVVVKK